MIRFIDIRNQGTGYRFAFWDTVTNSFLMFDGDQGFENRDDFEDAWLNSNKKALNLNRLKSLCPKWAHDNESDDIDKWLNEEENNV